MLSTTTEAVRSILKADPSLTPADRSRILAGIRNHGREPDKRESTPNRIMRRGEVAVCLGRSKRFVDKLAAEGILHKVAMPGRRRAIGFLGEDVEKLLGGDAAQANQAETQSGGGHEFCLKTQR